MGVLRGGCAPSSWLPTEPESTGRLTQSAKIKTTKPGLNLREAVPHNEEEMERRRHQQDLTRETLGTSYPQVGWRATGLVCVGKWWAPPEAGTALLV